MSLFQITIDGFESFVGANSTPEAIAYAGLENSDTGTECFEITVKLLTHNRVLHQADIKLHAELATSRELCQLQRVKISGLM